MCNSCNPNIHLYPPCPPECPHLMAPPASGPCSSSKLAFRTTGGVRAVPWAGVPCSLKHTAAMQLRFSAPAATDGGGAAGGGGRRWRRRRCCCWLICQLLRCRLGLLRRSLTAFVYKLGSAAVRWSSQQQRTVATSSMEAVAAATKEALWLRKLAADLSLSSSDAIPIR